MRRNADGSPPPSLNGVEDVKHPYVKAVAVGSVGKEVNHKTLARSTERAELE